jgi:soluble lytic murein transglycosylase-like protein
LSTYVCHEADVRLRRYHGRHLRRRPRHRGTVAVGTAAAVWASAPAARAGVHVVAPGETLSGIADRYGTTVERLVALNEIADPSLILAGQRLRVPARTLVASIHVVRRGETLSLIAARYHTTIEALARVNRIADPNLIVAGWRLRIPAGPSSSASGGVEASLETQARAHGVEASLVKAVAWHESAWRQDALSDAGAVGVMQVMPGTARFVKRTLGGGDLRLRSAEDNVALGVTYLDHLLETMPSERKALAAYVSGPNAVGPRLKGYQKEYVREVKALKPKF